MANYNHRVGEKWLTNEGYWVEIIEYFTALNCTIIFDDGVIMYNIKYSRFEKGTISKPKNRLGKVFTTTEGCKYTIIAYRKATDIDIQFEDGTILYNRQYGDTRMGSVKNPYYKSKYGVGYLGIGKHKSTLDGVDTPMYVSWTSMIGRCYNVNSGNYYNYADCSVDEKWHNYQVFGDWFDENYKSHMQSWHLDKDILKKGNKIYSPSTCCFVPQEINGLFTKCDKKRGIYPIGVYKVKNRYVAQISINSSRTKSLSFSTPEEAFYTYKTAKENNIKNVADRWKGQITEPCYEAMYNYEVEITD